MPKMSSTSKRVLKISFFFLQESTKLGLSAWKQLAACISHQGQQVKKEQDVDFFPEKWMNPAHVHIFSRNDHWQNCAFSSGNNTVSFGRLFCERIHFLLLFFWQKVSLQRIWDVMSRNEWHSLLDGFSLDAFLWVPLWVNLPAPPPPRSGRARGSKELASTRKIFLWPTPVALFPRKRKRWKWVRSLTVNVSV